MSDYKVRAVLAGFGANPPDTDEVERARIECRRALAFSLALPSEALERLVAQAFFDLPPDFIERFQGALDTVASRGSTPVPSAAPAAAPRMLPAS